MRFSPRLFSASTTSSLGVGCLVAVSQANKRSAPSEVSLVEMVRGARVCSTSTSTSVTGTTASDIACSWRPLSK